MKYLLDTALWLWSLAEPERFDPKARQLIAEGREELYLSAASSWEISIKNEMTTRDMIDHETVLF